MRILILGGTLFAGRHLAQAALAADHTVTLFHRGRTNPDLFGEAEHILGDREQDLSALGAREWDVVVDTSGYLPRVVEAAARQLVDSVGRYVFISSISVYQDPVVAGSREDAPTAKLPPEAARVLSGETYGALKAECEDVVAALYGPRALLIRPGLIVGPYDPTDRFTYWPIRIAQGGDVLIPDAPNAPAQWIDARDLAEWILHATNKGEAGHFNATGPAAPATLLSVLETCRELFAPQMRFVPVAEAFLVQNDVQPFMELPLWLPSDNQGLMEVDCSKAITAGLKFRPLEETLRDTYAWRQAMSVNGPFKAGLAAAREAELLARWRDDMGEMTVR